MASLYELQKALAPRMIEARAYIIAHADEYLKASDLFHPLHKSQVLYLVRGKLVAVCLVSWLYQERGFPREKIPFPIAEKGWPIFLVAAHYPTDADAAYYLAREAQMVQEGYYKRTHLLYWMAVGDERVAQAAQRMLERKRGK